MARSFRWTAAGMPLAMATLTAGAAAAALVLSSAETAAKVTLDSPYTVEQAFNAALRLVRVDHGFKVTERDPGAGYLLFEYKSAESGDRVTPGSIAIVRAASDTRIVIQLSSMPRYHEDVMMNELVRKLRAEYGEPVRGAGGSRADAGAADPSD